MPRRRMQQNTGRNVRRRRFTRRVPRAVVQNYQSRPRQIPHAFKRMTFVGEFAGSVAFTPLVDGRSFALSQLPNATEFANLYDQYQITGIQFRWHLRIDPSAQAAGTANFPRIYAVADYDDSLSPANLNEMRERSKVKSWVLRPNQISKMFIKPSTLGLVYRSNTPGSLYSYTPKWRQWIDMSTTDIPHYGIKFAVDDLTNTNYRLTMEAVYYFKCRNVR